MKNLYRRPGFIAQNDRHGSFAAGCPAQYRHGGSSGMAGCFGCDTACGKIMGVLTVGMWSLLCCLCTCLNCRSTSWTDCTTCEMAH